MKKKLLFSKIERSLITERIILFFLMVLTPFLTINAQFFDEISHPKNQSQPKYLEILTAKEKIQLKSTDKELFNLNGVYWQRDNGEFQYYLLPVIKDKKDFYRKISVYETKTNRYKKSVLKKVNVSISVMSKIILHNYCLDVPDYIVGSVNVLIPEKALSELSKEHIQYKSILPPSSIKQPNKYSDAPKSIIWSEGFEGSMSPYTIGYYSGYSSCYWGDVNCLSHTGGWSLWCADDGSNAPIYDCSNYTDNMSAYVYKTDGIYVGGYTDVNFSYWAYYNTEYNYDHTYQYYWDGVSSWVLDADYTGYSGGWTQHSWTLTGFTSFQWDFSFESDNSNSSYEGFFVDDMEIYGTADSYLSVYPTDQTVASSDVSCNFTVSSNVYWTTTESCPWINSITAYGWNDDIIIVDFDPNFSSSSRTCSIDINGGGWTQTVYLTQEGISPYLSVNPDQISVTSGQGTKKSYINSNINWTVSENCDWVSCSPVSWSNSDSLSINYTENTTGVSRSCTITILGSGLSSSIELNQEGLVGYLNLNPENATLGCSAGSFTNIGILSNTSWNITNYPSWIQVSTESGVGSGSITIAALTANSLPVIRTGTISFDYQGGSKQLQVTQQECSGIEDLALANSISIYPNPTKKLIYVKSSSSIFGLMNIDINDNKGGLIRKYMSLNLCEPNIIDFSDLSIGMYYLKIYNNEIFCIRSIVKAE